MAFRGWPAEGLDWLEDIREHNDRAWFLEHKDVYERSVKGPLEELFVELAAEFGPGRLFRPQRDVRFSKDKTPYKTNVAGATEDDAGATFYIGLSADELYAGSGSYHLASDQLARFREAVGGDAGEELVDVVATIRKAKLTVGGEALKRAPKGFAPDHPRIELLRHKGLYVGSGHAPGPWLQSAKAKDRVVKAWRAAAPLNRWMAANVGPSTLPPDRWS